MPFCSRYCLWQLWPFPVIAFTYWQQTPAYSLLKFIEGRNRNHQGLAAAIVKLWEKSLVVKIAVKRGIQNTNNKLMAEEIKVCMPLDVSSLTDTPTSQRLFFKESWKNSYFQIILSCRTHPNWIYHLNTFELSNATKSQNTITDSLGNLIFKELTQRKAKCS